jgi:hypothetical protein
MKVNEENAAPFFSRTEKQALGCIVVFVLITRILLIFRPESQIYSLPYSEDGFYLFSCAEHIAHGDGFTCDGKQPTNGVQPLLVIFYVPFFLLAGMNKLLAVKLSFMLVALFDSASALLIATLVRLLQKKREIIFHSWLSPPIIAAMCWAGLYTVFVHTANGLETGLYSMLLLAVLFYYAILSRMRKEGGPIKIRQWIFLGVLLGITVLSRIDAVFLVIAIAFYEQYTFKSKGFLQAALISFFAFIISSPWWWYNYTYFGNIMPQSGISESLGIPLRINLQDFALHMGELLTLFFFFPTDKFSAWFSFGWFLAILAGIYFLVRKYRPQKYLNDSYKLTPLTPYLIFCGLLCFIYVFFFNASYFYPRYFQPIRILWLMLFAFLAPEIFRILKGYYTKRKIFLIACIAVFSLSLTAFSIRKYSNLFLISKENPFYLTGKWALQHPSERIGMLQSGLTGFIAPNVVNLDGKVNFGALAALRKRDLGAYIESEKLDYLADWRVDAEGMARAASMHDGIFVETDSIGNIIIFKRKGN